MLLLYDERPVDGEGEVDEEPAQTPAEHEEQRDRDLSQSGFVSCKAEMVRGLN